MLARVFRWFETLINPYPPVPQIQPPARVGAFFWFCLRPVWWAFAALALVTVTAAVIEVAIYAFIGRIIDLMRDSANPSNFFSDHGVELAFMAFIALIARPALSALANNLAKHQVIAAPVGALIRWRAHSYVVRQSLGFFQNDFAGRVATRVIQLGPAVRDVAYHTCDVVVWVVVQWLGAFLLFFEADWRLVVPLAIWFAGYAVTLWYFIPRIGKLSGAMSEARSMMSGRLVDIYTNIMTVKLFTRTDREDAHAREAIDDHMRCYQRQLRLNTMLELVLWSLNGAVLVGTTALAVGLWSNGLVTIGAISVVTGLILRLMAMSSQFMVTLASIFENIGIVQESMMTIARPFTVVDAKDATPLKVVRGAIDFDDVSFDYGHVRTDSEERPVGLIHDFSLHVKPGEKVGLVGRSGAGKSTLVSLLLRFHDVEKGRILVDGQDIAHVTQDSLRSQIGVVMQDVSLLHRSVRDNILYGRPDAGEQQAHVAAQRAHAERFIHNLRDVQGRAGYDAHVGERGVKLSGGQRQRIAIARVLLKDAPLLVLDEATSALDSEVEAAIQEQLTSLMRGKTVIAIAHRLSTIAAMDRLVIMDEGKIVEQGTHAELLRRGGLYAELWARQSGGFVAQDAAE
jgi:ATP-binding cassette subfamily B multidrug efflux pump